MSHVSEIWIGSLVFGPIFAILFGTSSSSLVLGFIKYHECPLQPLLPQGLIGFGLIGSICSIVALILTIVSYFKVDDSGTHLWYLLYAIIMLVVYGICTITWTAIIILILRTKYSYYQSNNRMDPKSFCNSQIYHFTCIFAAIGATLVLISDSLIKQNKIEINNDFDYLFIFIYGYFADHFPPKQMICNIIKFTRQNESYYKVEYEINGKSSTIEI
ncbi:unnamed protein product [Rotaria socialis]